MIEIDTQLSLDTFAIEGGNHPFIAAKDRILPLDCIARLFEQDYPQQYIKSLTSGSFDLLHPGHLRYVEWLVERTNLRARDESKQPFVAIGINSDASTRASRTGRANGRPIFGELERAEMVAGWKGVNAVFIFDDGLELATLNPDLLQVFSLSDHNPASRPEIPLMMARGTQVVIIDKDPAHRIHSTSKVLDRIHQENIY